MVEFITNNQEELIAIVGSVVTIASVINKITPTETGNKVLYYLLKFTEIIGLNTKPVEKK